MLPSKRPCPGGSIQTNKDLRKRLCDQNVTKSGPPQSHTPAAAQPNVSISQASHLQGNDTLSKDIMNTEGQFLTTFSSDPAENDELLEACPAKPRSRCGGDISATYSVEKENVMSSYTTTMYCFGMVVLFPRQKSRFH
jgi:hypothetical protein